MEMIYILASTMCASLWEQEAPMSHFSKSVMVTWRIGLGYQV